MATICERYMCFLLRRCEETMAALYLSSSVAEHASI